MSSTFHRKSYWSSFCRIDQSPSLIQCRAYPSRWRHLHTNQTSAKLHRYAAMCCPDLRSYYFPSFWKMADKPETDRNYVLGLRPARLYKSKSGCTYALSTKSIAVLGIAHPLTFGWGNSPSHLPPLSQELCPQELPPVLLSFLLPRSSYL